jgi:hypothetical protein
MKPITIPAPNQGIAPSALVGFAEVRNLNITDKPGACYPNFKLANDDSTTPVIDQDLIAGQRYKTFTVSSNVVYAIGYSIGETPGKVFKRTNSGNWAQVVGLSNNPKNIIFYKEYIAVIYDTSIEWIDPTDGDAVITTSWGSILTAGGSKRALIAQDDCLYIAFRTGVQKIAEVDGETFDPSNPGTYEISTPAFRVPEGIIDIDEIGSQMLLSTDKSLRFWDLDSPSTEIGAKLNKRINHSIIYNNLVYVQAGFMGEWYVSNGTTVEPFAKMPETLLNAGTNNVRFTAPIIRNELIYFGVYSEALGVSPAGIYSLNPRTKALNLEHTLSTGKINDDNTLVTISGIIDMEDNGFLVGYRQTVSVGELVTITPRIDYLTSTKNTGDASIFVIQLLPLGGKDNKETISKIEIQLTKPLVSGDSLKLYRRNAITGNWTQHGDTKSYSASLSQQSFSFPAISNVENIQFKVVLNNEAEYFKMILY